MRSNPPPDVNQLAAWHEQGALTDDEIHRCQSQAARQ
jgi:hypothetical protein